MGTGPILLPPAVAAAGLGLSSIWLIIIAILSVMGAEFVLEVINFKSLYYKTLSIVNCIKIYGALDYSDRESCEVPLSIKIFLFLILAMNIERLKNYFGMRETIEFSGMG